MFVILTYDVKSKRDNKVIKICRKYLTHDQKAVFEGMITEKKLDHLKHELEQIIVTEEDSINIYEFSSMKYCYKERIGVNFFDDNIL